ncbi:hypothetical protein DPMN_061321 [Dreissena polymorpha]|uniref:Uncharacterized protein n=1 Tax=Dreissena polymorpha TaxID=45954 RepID=A0A9D4C7I5_DREPO|nr:hypothetical protein DPMN_061321 [Dreissena polymorpha]
MNRAACTLNEKDMHDIRNRIKQDKRLLNVEEELQKIVPIMTDNSEVIGNEEKWNEQVARKINTELNIASFTGDGDSKGHSGVDKAQAQFTQGFRPPPKSVSLSIALTRLQCPRQ